ncbi:phosphoribosylamine--glycine ligase [Candidatus Fermentibacteria bacterium]|nr:phosphoribosylamine--glycine ligase [Candidatus Fermentibacteria bacterium]
MKVLVAGSGGREHAIAWALSRSGRNEVHSAPGNPGMAGLGPCHPVSPMDGAALARLCRDIGIGLVVIGPEAPLEAGVAAALRAEGMACFGPDASGARIESSKWFAKDVMKAAGVPTADARHFDSASSALSWMGDRVSDWVIKADGLAAGKGVFLPETLEEASLALDSILSSPAGAHGLLVERRLEGREASVMAVCCGKSAFVLPPSRDHKRAFDGDEGPNTGGMGAVCPPPGLAPDFDSRVLHEVFLPVLDELAARGIDYRGVLYAGLMVSGDDFSVLEFNCRFGDPETQSVLPLLEGDLAGGLHLAASGSGVPGDLRRAEGASACVVVASGGYPGPFPKGHAIEGLEEAGREALVFHAGTASRNGRIVTDGGRVVSLTGTGRNLEEALERAYRAASLVRFEGAFYRRDIGRTT